MQTFLPFASFEISAAVLDYRRLGKQRVEARQLIDTIMHGGGWSRHPAAVMWQFNVPALMRYHDVVIKEWVRRGYKNSMPLFQPRAYTMPVWFGDDIFHSSHRSNLLRKDPVFYSAYGWTEEPNQPYIWPVPFGEPNGAMQ